VDDLDIGSFESILELFREPIVEFESDDAAGLCGQLGCEDASASAYLDDGIGIRNIERLGDFADDIAVMQEVLPERFLGAALRRTLLAHSGAWLVRVSQSGRQNSFTAGWCPQP